MRLRSCLAICVALATCAIGVQTASAGFVVNWNIDSAQSFVQLNIPQQGVPLDLGSGVSTIQIRLRNQSGGTAWNQGNKAQMGGTIATDMDLINSTIEFLGGASNMYGINSGSYKPDSTSPAPNNAVALPAVFGAKAQAQVLIFLDAANIAIRDIFYDADSNPISIVPAFPGTGARTFNATQMSFGVQSGTAYYAGFGAGASLGSAIEPFPPTSAANISSAGSITVPNVLLPQNKKLTITLNIPIAIDLGDIILNATATGSIVAFAVVPEASSFLMAGMALSAFAVPSMVRYRRRKNQA